jgi:hypothetical protein
MQGRTMKNRLLEISAYLAFAIVCATVIVAATVIVDLLV